MFYLIHQAGKVASQSLETTIQLTDPSARVERYHYLERANLQEVDMLCDRSPPTAQMQELRGQTRLAKTAASALAQEDPRNVWVLTGIRDPLDFAISAFFQNLAYYYPSYNSPAPDESYDADRFDVEVDRVIDVFRREFAGFAERARAGTAPRDIRELETRRKLQDLGEWFDREFKRFHGVDFFAIDVGAKPFVRFESERGTFILYRMEMFREAFTDILKELPLLTVPRVTDRNLASDKDYAVLYQRFRQRIVPTPAMVDYYYGSRFYRHFYAGAEPLYSLEHQGNRALV
jgi:hypothetical protein